MESKTHEGKNTPPVRKISPWSREVFKLFPGGAGIEEKSAEQKPYSSSFVSIP
jgi:hypothetical protein